MISVSSNELGLGFGGIEEDIVMEESDFEEESTHSYVSCVDPDVALSYIDEKLENVLGHFQKDFEGGVSAENLGSKFGGYGSFLSMYQRSPVCSSTPRSPLEAQNQMGVRSNCVPEVSISESTSKTPASDVLVKLKNFVNSSDSKQKPVSKTSSSGPSSNHKTLKLRIKVGSSDLSSLKNSKEGLKLPPSSSQVNNCFSEVEEGLLYEIGDSPTKILMAMVTFPLHKDQLLSPLSDDLIQFGKKEKIGYVSSVNVSDSKGTVKKEKLKERVKSEKVSCEEIVSKTLKLPVLSPPKKEIDKVSNSYVEDVDSRARGRNNIDVVDVTLIGSKPDVEDNVAVFSNRSVKETESVNNTRKDVYRTEGETRSSLERKSKWEKAPSIERVDHSSVDKVKTKNEEQILKSKLPKAQKSRKRSGRSSLRGKDDATVNIINTNVQEDIGGSRDVYKGFFGDIGESKEGKLSSCPVLKAVEKEEVTEENTLKESFKGVKNYEEACNLVCEPDSKHLIKSSDLNEDKHSSKQSVKREENALKESFSSVKNGEEACNKKEDSVHGIKSSETKQSVKREVTNKHSVEGGTENLGMEPERELSGKPKTGKSRFSAVESNIEASSAKKVKDIGKASSHDDRKRKLKEDKENGDCMKLKDAATVVMDESSGEKARKKKRLNGSSSCDGKELPFSSESCDKEKRVSASHLPLTASSPSLCKDLGHEAKTSGRISEKDGVDSNVGGDTLKRSRDGEGYSNIDKPGSTTKKAAEISKDNNDLLITEKATHSWDKEKSYGESQRKNRGERSSSAPSKVNNRANTENGVGVRTKESRSKKRPARKEEDSREYRQDPNTKLDIDSGHLKTSRGKSNHSEAKVENKSSAPTASKDQVQVLVHGSEKTNTKKQSTRNEQNGSKLHKDHHIGLSQTSTSQAASNSIKEATDLKHMADRLKNGGSNHESTGVYFQAALKFLHGASLLESSSSSSNAKSKHIYGSTAKLCDFCAHEYEKNKDMGAAALAYKCMEVAYLRITYSSHGNISRYRHELQAALQLIPPPSGESPSFVSSDGENPNHAEKVGLSNTVRSSSPRVTGNNHVISSGNNSSVSQLLAFSQNVSYAMDASRKAQMAFATAKGKPFDNRYSSSDGDGITSIKRALDFSFQDMEKLLHVVRLAMESINR